MQSEQIGMPSGNGWAARQVARLPRRRSVRLTSAERRWLLSLVDLLLVNAALAVTVVLWGAVEPSVPVLLAYYKWFVTLSVIWLVLGFALDVYDPIRAASTTYSLVNCSVAALLAGVLYQLIPWFAPPLGRRLFFFGLPVFMALGVAAWRVAYVRLFSQPSFQRRVLVVGQGTTARRLAEALDAAAEVERANPLRGTGYHVLGFVDRLPEKDPSALDSARALVRRIRTEGVDEVLVAEEDTLSHELREALLDCREIGIHVFRLSEAYERLVHRLPVEYAERDLGLLLSADDGPSRRLYWAAKRLLDVLLALAGLSVLTLLAPWVALFNALTSPGPLFYRQQRVGRGGRPFAVFKFRTMRPDAEKDSGAVWAAQDDPRVTFVGRWLRRSRLDELPQVVNVLRGEMSVVGPRPERPQLAGQISSALPIYRARHAVRPGITGWAQVRYRYGGSVEDARVKLEYDLYYVKHAGFFLDILILLQTPAVMLKLEGP
jgi:exopolysaccharide biosynthesis polyprenyl glycosylphosphotransferase